MEAEKILNIIFGNIGSRGSTTVFTVGEMDRVV
jgi:hypothetical protein